LRDLRWKLVVIGKGDFEETLRQLCGRRVIDRVEFLGFVPRGNAPLSSAFDLLVVPSETQPNWKEQFGRVITEAMSAGTRLWVRHRAKFPISCAKPMAA
jgi:glycosyltransferase involved in cell wall biosynthesis